jgi:hypothetical protein
MLWFKLFVITVLIEGLGILILKKIKAVDFKRPMVTLLVANLVTHPALYFTLNQFDMQTYLVLGEYAVVLIETFVYQRISHEVWAKCCASSFILNGASWYLGNWYLRFDFL